MTETWTCQHLSLANPRETSAADLPLLLRRLAEHIAAVGMNPADILDVTVTQEITEHGPWWSATVCRPRSQGERRSRIR